MLRLFACHVRRTATTTAIRWASSWRSSFQRASNGRVKLAASTVVLTSGFASTLQYQSNASVCCQAATGRFEGKTIVITGAGGNFGREGCIFFAKEGANVVAIDVTPGSLAETVKEVEAATGRKCCISVVCDVRKQQDVDNIVQSAISNYGKIDMLWNNAGYQGAMVNTPDYPIKDFQMVMDINVVGAFAVLQAVGNAMAKTGGGTIVNTASVAALRGTPTMPAYVASKSAILGMTMSVAKDLAPHNIRVNAVSPALIGPGYMWDRQNELHAKANSPYFSNDPEVVAKNKINSVPMKRLGSIEEVVKTVAFLLSDDSSYTTGTNSVVAGGLA